MQIKFKPLFMVVVIIFGLSVNFVIFSFGRKTFFGIRSQGLNAVRELAGWQQCMFQCDKNRNFGVFSASIEYDHSFRSEDIVDFIIGEKSLRFRGSRSTDRQSGDIMADYFGLPIDFASNVCFSPVISSTIIDFDLFQAFDAVIPGLFFMFHVPIIHTKWTLTMKESGIKSGTTFYPAGYMSDTRINVSSLPQTVTQAMRGMTVFGDMQEPLQYGKIEGRQTRSRVAELQATVGWNYNASWYHAGVNFRVGAPTGNVPTAQFLFEDIVGNRHHWDVGFGLSGHVDAWRDKETGKTFALYADAHISHLCSSRQKRSFNFVNNGPGSRYMLLEQIDAGSPNGLWINGTSSVNYYAQRLVPAINYTTFDTIISIGVQADIVVKLTYQRDGFECDLGYNFWVNSREKLHARCMFPSNRFALKGDGQEYGFSAGNDTIIVPLNATQNSATIFGGQGKGNANFQNANADNQPAPASLNGSTVLLQLNNADATALGITRVQVQGSDPSRLLDDTDIDNASALLPRALSNKLFTFVNYKWDNGDDIDPYAGLGLSVEVAHMNVCSNAACSQWAVWFKTGFAY